jgi:hypothetical protein
MKSATDEKNMPSIKPTADKKYQNFQTLVKFTPKNTNYHHQVYEITKPYKIQSNNSNSKRNTKKWICKIININTYEINLREAQKEVAAQEFFRLLMPHQPKTRWLVSSKNPSVIMLISEKMHDFSKYELNNQIFYARADLAGITLISLFLNENDLKNGNVGLSNGRMIKIDSGQCFAQLMGYTEYAEITASDLRILPDVEHYTPSNWLWFLGNDERYNEDDISLELHDDPQFKSSLYKTILQIILLSDEFINDFLSCYITNSEYIAQYKKIMISRRDQLRKEALSMQRFMTYMNSASSEQDFSAYITQLRNFKPMGKYRLWDQIPNAEQKMKDRFATYKLTCLKNTYLNI